MVVNLEIDEETGLLNIKQPGLVDRVINAVGLENGMAKGNYTPSGYVYLVNNQYGVPASVIFKYSSVVGIMLCLFGNTHPDIYFAFNCCANYMFFPKNYYEKALKQIGRYLKSAPGSWIDIESQYGSIQD